MASKESLRELLGNIAGELNSQDRISNLSRRKVYFLRTREKDRKNTEIADKNLYCIYEESAGRILWFRRSLRKIVLGIDEGEFEQNRLSVHYYSRDVEGIARRHLENYKNQKGIKELVSNSY